MIQERFRIDHIKDANGKSPYREWYHSLSDNLTKTIIDARLARVRLGNFGDCKGVGKGVFELRIKRGPGHRIYFGKEEENLILLVSGGDKGSQEKDIKRAQKLWGDRRR